MLTRTSLAKGLAQTTLLRCYTVRSNQWINVKSCADLRNSCFPTYTKKAHSKLCSMTWDQPLQNIFITKKPWNVNVRLAMVEIMSHISQEYPDVNMIVTEEVADELIHETANGGIDNISRPLTVHTGHVESIIDKTDMILTVGGDGTILRAVSLFSNYNVPPILSLAMGTLGFLLPFDFKLYKETFKDVYESRSMVLQRRRLECHLYRTLGHIKAENAANNANSDRENNGKIMIHAMNDISLHRGSQPNLISLDIFIDNEFLTTTTADGIICSTPTGSTAYALSSGGSIAHPNVPCILLTPICPRSLSFRPLILPATSHITIRLSERNRNIAIRLAIDGISQSNLKPGDEIHILSETEKPSQEKKGDEPDTRRPLDQTGIHCVTRGENDWTKDINELLGFNSSFTGKRR